MKILLTAVNAKYIHSNLAIYSLSSYAEKMLSQDVALSVMPEIEIAEYTINQPVSKIITDIYRKKPDVLFLSCYIWNRKEIEEIAADMGKVRPDMDIWLGGPEVSFDSVEMLEQLTNVKGVLRGEGEDTFYNVVRAYAERGGSPDERLYTMEGVTFRDIKGDIIVGPDSRPLDLSQVPFPYETLEGFEHRIIYYESSRGCPFRCSYCLSSVEKTLRFRDMELVKKELAYFIERKVPQVKFIDRTFNCTHERATEIWRYIREHDNGITNFHFEIAGDLLKEEELELLRGMRPGQVQLEIGVQSTNEETLREIDRPMDFAYLSRVVRSIKECNNVHLHLDLIAGLPFEDYESFRKSFDDVFALRPHQLQLGFLKVLKGSPMEKRCVSYGLKHTELPPYEVMETNWITYDDLIKLKSVEEMVEVYYNSGQFVNTIELLIRDMESPFVFFEKLAQWYETQGSEMLNFSRNQRYEMLLDFASGLENADPEKVKAAMTFDYYMRENAKNRPQFLGEENVSKAFSKEFYSREARRHRFLKGGRLDTDDPRLLRKLTHIERYGDRYYLFDYSHRSPMDGNARVVEIEDIEKSQ